MIAYADGREFWWVRMAITFVIAGVLIGRTTWLGCQHRQLVARNRVLEERDADLSKRLRLVEKQQAELRQDVQARLAVKQWRRAFGDQPMRLVAHKED